MLTGKFRASYAHVFEPQTGLGGGEPKYSITLLIPKTDVATINQIYAEIEKAKQEGVQKVFGGKMPPAPKIPLYDGDGVRPNGEPFGEESTGCMVMTASSKTRPSVVDLNLQPIINPAEFYSGCYARATLNFFAYNQNGNKGIGCGLNNVQKLAEGDPLSGRTSAEDDFGGANAYQSGVVRQQAYYAQPYQPVMTPNSSPIVPNDTSNQVSMPNYQQSYAQVPMMAIDPITGLPVPQGGVMGI